MLLNESLYDVRIKNAKNLSDEDFKKALEYDPKLYDSANLSLDDMKNIDESYMKWILKMYSSNSLNNYPTEQVRNILATFDQAKKRRNLLPNNDINTYHTIREIINALSEINDRLSANQKNKDARNNQKNLKKADKQLGMYMDGAVELLFYGDEWEVWTPHTFEGSKALRRGAVWCTGGESNYHYNSYTNDGTLYVIMNKKDNSEKYQLFVPFNPKNQAHKTEYRDKDNESQSFRRLCLDNKELLDFFIKRKDVIAVYPNLDDETAFIGDEKEERRLMDIYGLGYFDEYNNLVMDISLDTVLYDCSYLTPESVSSIVRAGYTDYSFNDEDLLKNYLLENENFIECFEKKAHMFEPLMQKYSKATSNNEYNTSDDNKLQTFVNTVICANIGRNKDTKLFKWLMEISNTNNEEDYKKMILEKISTSAITDILTNYVYDEIKEIYDIRLSDLSENFKAYIEGIPFVTKEQNIQEFYEQEILGHGFQNQEDYVDYYGLRMDDSDIPNYVKYFLDFNSFYVGNDFDKEDIKSILNVFITEDDLVDPNSDTKELIPQIIDNLSEVVGSQNHATTILQDIRMNDIDATSFYYIVECLKNNNISDDIEGVKLTLLNGRIIDYVHGYKVLDADLLFKMMAYDNNGNEPCKYDVMKKIVYDEFEKGNYDTESLRNAMMDYVKKTIPELFGDKEVSNDTDKEIDEVLRIAGVK